MANDGIRTNHNFQHLADYVRTMYLGSLALWRGGDDESLNSAPQKMGCLPLAERGLRAGKSRKVLTVSLIFLAVIALIMSDIPANTLVMEPYGYALNDDW